jgi:hypothetical protein
MGFTLTKPTSSHFPFNLITASKVEQTNKPANQQASKQSNKQTKN